MRELQALFAQDAIDIEFAAEMTGFMEIVRWCRQGRLLSMLCRRFRVARHLAAQN